MGYGVTPIKGGKYLCADEDECAVTLKTVKDWIDSQIV